MVEDIQIGNDEHDQEGREDEDDTNQPCARHAVADEPDPHESEGEPLPALVF